MLTYFIDAPHPEPNSTVVLYYYSNDFPSVKLKFRIKTIQNQFTFCDVIREIQILFAFQSFKVHLALLFEKNEFLQKNINMIKNPKKKSRKKISTF